MMGSEDVQQLELVGSAHEQFRGKIHVKTLYSALKRSHIVVKTILGVYVQIL